MRIQSFSLCRLNFIHGNPSSVYKGAHPYHGKRATSPSTPPSSSSGASLAMSHAHQEPVASTSRAPSFMSPVASTNHSPTSTLHELPTTASSRLPPTLEAELARDESRFESYGGDDPIPPTPKTPATPFPPPPQTTLEKDTNLVTWDGPNDPGNPQNWSKLKKWVVTWTCVVLSINV